MKIYTPLKAIRKKCLDCCSGQVVEVRECPCKHCTLWPYRMGHRPEKNITEDKDDDRDHRNRANVAG